jgi:glycosyltransferase involved in cell wall biosynthesis
MKKLPSCTLVTPTYNWPDALELLLLSVLNQTILPNEVMIADDGSKEDTKKLIEKFQENFPIPLVHIWHEDIKNRNRNCDLFSEEEMDKFKMHCELPDLRPEQPMEEPAIQITRRVTEFPTLNATRPALRRIPRLYTTANTTGTVQIDAAIPLPMEEPMFKFDLEDDIEVEDVLP